MAAAEDIQNDLDNSGLKVEDVSENGEISEADYTESSSDENNSKTLSIVASGLQKCKPPVFGHVAISHSENVQFGNNTYFNGPVTIKQVIQSNNGIENPSYVKSDHEDVQNKVYQNGISKSDDSSGKVSGFKRRHLLIVVMLGLVVTVAAVCSIVFSRNRHDNVSDSYSLGENELCQGNDTTTSNPLIIAPFHLRIVSRSDWLAQPEAKELDKINQPVPWVVITHTATESCHNQSECVLRVRLIQSFHVESRGWDDIGYNFLVGGDGSAYYGRGWDYIGAHTKGYNKYSIAIAFIGTFSLEAPPRQQLDACKKLINIGVSLGKLSKNYKLLAHSQLMSTASPGQKLFDIIKEWPHFVKDPSDLDETFAY